MKIKVLYENANILAIDKPSGISVHPDGKIKEKTIVDWVLKNYPYTKDVGEPMGDIVRPGIVHRLDRDTSGVMLIAKNQKVYLFLKNQFKNRKIKKIYNTIVCGWVRDDRGIVNKPIGRSPRDFRRHLSGRGARGEMRDAMTHYKVLERVETSLGKFTYLEIRPKTGRTHQIRVHMKYLNHPVVCDALYNPRGVCPEKIKRLALHASSIEFHNLKGEIIKVESPLPKEFSNVVK